MTVIRPGDWLPKQRSLHCWKRGRESSALCIQRCWIFLSENRAVGEYRLGRDYVHFKSIRGMSLIESGTNMQPVTLEPKTCIFQTNGEARIKMTGTKLAPFKIKLAVAAPVFLSCVKYIYCRRWLIITEL